MPYLETAQSWLEQSTLLLKARPTTTRITTKYTLLPLTSQKAKPRAPKPRPSATMTDEPFTTPATSTVSEPIRATLTLKTYDPVSGTTLKYQTIKAAEVARLIQILGRLARPMAGLPEVKEDAAMAESAVADVGSGVATPALETPTAGGKGGGQGGAGGKKGKKKGKK